MGFRYEKINNEESGERPVLEQAHERAVKLLEENQINEDSFVDTYGERTVSNDRRKVRKREQSFEGVGSESHKWSEILEGIILNEGEQSLWFGERAMTMKASKYDDYFNGTDIVLEILEDDEGRSAKHFSLGIDATFAAGVELGNKIDKILTQIENGEMGSIKYFVSERLGFEGRLKNVPHLIIGIQRESVQELAKRWIDLSPREMAEDPVQFVILEEMRIQCEVLASYAKRVGQDDIAERYKKALKTIEEIIEERGGINFGEGENDRVFMAIKEEFEKLGAL